MELGTRLHQEIESLRQEIEKVSGNPRPQRALIFGDMHAGMYESVAEHATAMRKTSAQLRVYASAVAMDEAIYGRADVLVIHGGDLLQLAVKDVDFSKIERRVLDHMVVDMAKKIELDTEDVAMIGYAEEWMYHG
jgi:hypothetical protein